jgi:hypothetical protein
MNPEKLRSVKVPVKTTRSFYPKNVAKDAHAFWIQLGCCRITACHFSTLFGLFFVACLSLVPCDIWPSKHPIANDPFCSIIPGLSVVSNLDF